MRSERLKGHLDLLLLSVLSRGPGHGYEVITRLRDRSGGTFELPEGTVYPALHRLEEGGLLASAWDVVSGRRRRIYRLTRRARPRSRRVQAVARVQRLGGPGARHACRGLRRGGRPPGGDGMSGRTADTPADPSRITSTGCSSR